VYKRLQVLFGAPTVSGMAVMQLHHYFQHRLGKSSSPSS